MNYGFILVAAIKDLLDSETMRPVIVFLSNALAVTAATFGPTQYTTANTPTTDGLAAYSGQSVTLDTNTRVLTLDYGTEVGGWPWIEVSTLDNGPVEVELKYSEMYDGLFTPLSDGPW